MSIRHEFSYWLTAKPVSGLLDESADAFVEALQNQGVAEPDGDLYMEIDITSMEITGEVNPDIGTVPENNSLLEGLKIVAAQFPQFDIEFQEIDEEDHSHETLTKFHDGKIVEEGMSRTVGPDSKYDQPTVTAIADYLDRNGYHRLAEVIKANFSD